jgi:hypothetical protein
LKKNFLFVRPVTIPAQLWGKATFSPAQRTGSQVALAAESRRTQKSRAPFHTLGVFRRPGCLRETLWAFRPILADGLVLSLTKKIFGCMRHFPVETFISNWNNTAG